MTELLRTRAEEHLPPPHAWQLPAAEVDPNPDPDPTAREQWLSGSYAQGTRSLRYRLYVPPGAVGAARRPMVVMLHGCMQDAQDFADGTRMNELARAAGVMVLYPEQLQRANTQNCWNWFKAPHQRRGRGEPELLASLVRELTFEYDADPTRVYVAGLSSGGAMAAILARCYPELFAAVGVHSGVPAGVAHDLETALDAMRHGVRADGGGSFGCTVPLIVFHGDADDVVHANNGRALAAAACKAQGLQAEPESTGGRSANCRSFLHRAFRRADGRPGVEHWQLFGAGHAWSGGDAAASYTAAGGPDASAEMLRFFLLHRAPCVAGSRRAAGLVGLPA